ncbi:MFS general substrate transporter [Rhodocollybia butyracea]|uniref:MFS general substrate transporter n=1 Tax=Rhodocollybia butyracea TaxID=206335 RepID=A0A9P5TXZ5_9AGAR|nr:MFS general substrate transporter [Rhodocollybia butyracea]
MADHGLTQEVPTDSVSDMDRKQELTGTDSASDESKKPELNWNTFYEQRAGRLVVDPKEASIEFGEAIASKLKLSEDGTKVLWPQPTDSKYDPQNWSSLRKNMHLLIITLAAIVPDFDSGIGIAGTFQLATQYDTTTGVIINETANWSIFLLGWGGLFAVILIRRYGRLPVLFWSQVLAAAFLAGCTFAPNLRTFTVMRCLTALFGTAPQVTGLYVVTDLFPFHLQARKLNIWTMGFILSPFISPFAFGFLVARLSWRWAYGIGSIYGAIVCILIMLFMEETMYDRNIDPIPEPAEEGFSYRFKTLIGITGYKMSKYRLSWYEATASLFRVVWRPHLLIILVFEALVFGFSIGINVTTPCFWEHHHLWDTASRSLLSLAVMGRHWCVGIIIGELIGRFNNDYIMNVSIRRNNGVFEAESRLWACYVGIPLYICGFVLLGASFQNQLSPGAFIMGFGISMVAVMIITVAVYAYCNDCFPQHPGEISALVNLARTLGGFAVAYFQIPWAVKNGTLQVFGVESAVVTGLFFLCVPLIQIKGRYFRERFSL